MGSSPQLPAGAAALCFSSPSDKCQISPWTPRFPLRQTDCYPLYIPAKAGPFRLPVCPIPRRQTEQGHRQPSYQPPRPFSIPDVSESQSLLSHPGILFYMQFCMQNLISAFQAVFLRLLKPFPAHVLSWNRRIHSRQIPSAESGRRKYTRYAPSAVLPAVPALPSFPSPYPPVHISGFSLSHFQTPVNEEERQEVCMKSVLFCLQRSHGV